MKIYKYSTSLLPSLSVCFLFCGNLWDKFYDKIIFSWHLRRQQGSAKFVDECAMGGKFLVSFSLCLFLRKMRCTCIKHEKINAPFTHYKLRLIAESSMILFPVHWAHQAARSSTSQISPAPAVRGKLQIYLFTLKTYISLCFLFLQHRSARRVKYTQTHNISSLRSAEYHRRIIIFLEFTFTLDLPSRFAAMNSQIYSTSII